MVFSGQVKKGRTGREGFLSCRTYQGVVRGFIGKANWRRALKRIRTRAVRQAEREAIAEQL